MIRKILAVCVALLLALTAAAEGFVAISAGGAHALALDAGGTVWAWGSNVRGESDPGASDAHITALTAVLEGVASIACGRNFSLALTAEGALYGWGDNRSGQLPGVSEARAEAPALLREGVRSMDACEERAALVTADGEAYAWGAGEEMQRLCEGAAEVAVGVDFVLVRLETGEVYEYADDSEAARLLEGASDIDAYGQTRMALASDGTLYAWGASGDDGRLGLPTDGWISAPTPLSLTGVQLPAAGLTASGAVTETGEAYLWGTVYSYVVLYDENGDPAASVVDGPLVAYGSTPIRLYDGVRALAFGDAFVLLLRRDGTILAWGSNDHGQMADGSWTKAELADGDDEDEKDVVITEADQFVFPAFLTVPGAA